MFFKMYFFLKNMTDDKENKKIYINGNIEKNLVYCK